MTRELLRSGTALALLTCVVATAIHPAAAQDAAILQREDDDEERLRRWMAVRAARSPEVGWLGGVAIGAGALAVAGGIAIPALTEQPSLTLPSVGLVVVGALEIGLGVFLVLAPNIARDEYRRIGDGPLTEREIGRLEGLLRHDADFARMQREMTMGLGIAMLAGGVAALPVVALDPPPTELDAGLSWGIAAGASLIGLLYLVMSLFESPAESDWRDYRNDLMPQEEPQVSVLPTGNGIAVMF
ncbi:MAG: hypothetical protein M3Y87_15815 [Myxococcota bacterium]|nr:hypothetical protein [Myxococcota bacterium]